MLKRLLLTLSVSRAPALGMAVAAAIMALTPAAAHASYCSHLEAQMRALDAGSRANPEQISRYDAAIVTQQRELQRAQMQSNQAGCAMPGIGGNAAVCASLGNTIHRMATNLTDLQRTRDRLAASAGVATERRRLEAALTAAGCRQRRERAAASAPAAASAQTASASQTSAGSTYRTLCVRMCDGFFFPISHATPDSMFARDERLCSARCPGTQVELHYHRFPGEEAEDAVSVSTGRIYRETENAFRYRQTSWERPGNCGCGIERGFDVLAGQTPEPAETGAEEPTAAIPPAHLRATLEPRGSFLIRSQPEPEDEVVQEEGPAPASAVPAVEAPAAEADETERRVRVVGPTFLPAPEAAIDLRAPAQSRAR